MLRYLLCLFAILWVSRGYPIDSRFELSVVHLNDFHARFEETNQKSSSCKGVDCIGGISRVYSIVTQLIKERPNPIFLNAGDNYQGTLWYTLFKYNVTEHFLSMLPTDAYTLGNHEFDDQIKGLVPFMKTIKAPFVVSNIDDTDAPELRGLYKKSIVIERGEKRIGIVGCITVTTNEISSSEGIKFLDESESVNKESERLVSEEKVDTIIVLSHAGYEVDIHIAENASPKIGLIVGGHSHTFLFTGKHPPGPDRPAGPYPTIVNHTDGRKILITQAASYTKYVGNITVFYNQNGDVSGWSGAPIYLDKNIPQDEAVEKEVLEWKKAVDQQGAIIVGETKLLLSNSGCRVKECTMGDLVTDSMAFNYPQTESSKQWPHAPIGLTIPGGIRTAILVGSISFNDLVTCLPFGNTVDFAEVQGKHIRAALEFSASAYHDHNGTNFLQVSGLRVVYNLTQPAGSRIMSLKVRCNKCSETEFVKFDDEVYYRVAVNSFLADGGDGHAALGNNLRNRITGEVDVDVLLRYIKEYTPLSVKKDGRIKIVT